MSSGLYRTLVLSMPFWCVALGMRLSRVLALVDAGRKPESNDLFLLAGMTIVALLNVWALLGVRVDDRSPSPPPSLRCSWTGRPASARYAWVAHLARSHWRGRLAGSPRS